jgi:ABC-type branched-subunit amino acid transport system ATPase component
MLDEPSAGMNDYETKELIEFVFKIREQYALTVFS